MFTISLSGQLFVTLIYDDLTEMLNLFEAKQKLWEMQDFSGLRAPRYVSENENRK